MSSTINQIPAEEDANWIPEGYAIILRPDGQRYVVPEFAIPALSQIFDGYRKKVELDVFKAAGTVSPDIFYHIFQEKPAQRWSIKRFLVPTISVPTTSLPVIFNLFRIGSSCSGQVPHAHADSMFDVIGEGNVMLPNIPVSLIFRCLGRSLSRLIEK
jgi:hypothetical protein